jgi:DNA oxidative demethylase
MALPGFQHLRQYFARTAQEALLADVRRTIAAAPLYTPAMPRSGRPMSVRMTNCGPLGWVTDKAGGYRYQDTHPVTGAGWPAMPQLLLALWQDVTNAKAGPEACLVNYYGATAKLGLHQDMDEEDRSMPVVSVSLGDDAWFRVGGLKRTDPSERVLLKSGDVVVLGGASRLAFHGVDRILGGTSDLLVGSGLGEHDGSLFGSDLGGGRINLTLRRVSLIEV